MQLVTDISTITQHSKRYTAVFARIQAILEGETDWIAAQATVACELHHEFDHFDWTGFYRAIAPELLAVGPYQGGHGCLRIKFGRGVCGTAAASKTTQLVADVSEFPGHIACSSTTLSEIVVPIMNAAGEVIAVLDVDSNTAAAFDLVDQEALEALCADLGTRFG